MKGAFDGALASEDLLRDPYPVYNEIRESAGTYFSPALRQWLVTRHDDVERMLLDPGRFSSFGWESSFVRRLPEQVLAKTPTLLRHFAAPGLIYSDPPAHTRLRRLINRAFTPRSIAPLRAQIVAQVEVLLACAGARPGDVFDLVAGLAFPLPARVIALLLGLPPEDAPLLHSWTGSMLRFFGRVEPDPEAAAVAEAALSELRDYAWSFVEQRRRAPQDDVLSMLSVPDANGDVLDPDELLSTVVILVVAGHETTTGLIGNTVLALQSHPAALDLVRGDPDLVDAAIEETLRFDPPVQRVRRVATAPAGPAEAGAAVGAGDTVVAVLAAANRDPRVFTDPDRFVLGRPRGQHIAFGKGPHACIGSALARLEAPIAVEGLLRLFPSLRSPAGWSPEWNRSHTLRSLAQLPLVVEHSGRG
jgi:cytochrome P450